MRAGFKTAEFKETAEKGSNPPAPELGDAPSPRLVERSPDGNALTPCCKLVADKTAVEPAELPVFNNPDAVAAITPVRSAGGIASGLGNGLPVDGNCCPVLGSLKPSLSSDPGSPGALRSGQI